MNKKRAALTVGFIAVAAALAVMWISVPPGPVRNGILLGTALALAQSLLSVVALRAVLKTILFYAVWIGGIFMRVAVLVLTAVFVHRHNNQFQQTATLLTLVVATMFFLILEMQGLLTD